MAQQETIGRYQILERIASGAQGSVDRAFDPEAGRLVAIKVLHPSYVEDKAFIDRFRREAELAASVDHPNVVQIYDVDEDSGRQFIAMEFLPENLRRLIDQGQMPADWTANIAAQIADGLGSIHAQGIVHRDMKPHNVLITPDGVPKITDFGIARGGELATITATGVMMGTPHYMAPEQAEGHRADARSDVYALGCMMYHMLTGVVPFTGDTPLSVLKKHVEQQANAISEVISNIQPALERVIERAMAKDPKHRYEDGNSMAKALREVMADITVVPMTLPIGDIAQGVEKLPSRPAVASENDPTWKAQGAALADALDAAAEEKKRTEIDDNTEPENQGIQGPEPEPQTQAKATPIAGADKNSVSDSIQHPVTLFFIGVAGLSIIELLGLSPFPNIENPWPGVVLGTSAILGAISYVTVYLGFEDTVPPDIDKKESK